MAPKPDEQKKDLSDVETYVDLLIEELVLLQIQPEVIYSDQKPPTTPEPKKK